MTRNYILLKWGTLKGYRVADNPVAQGLIEQYMELGASGSAMHQQDTSQQKQIICELLPALACPRRSAPCLPQPIRRHVVLHWIATQEPVILGRDPAG